MGKKEQTSPPKEETNFENLLLDIMEELRSKRNMYKIVSHKRPTYLMVIDSDAERRFAQIKFVEGNENCGHHHGTFDSTKTTWDECNHLIGFQSKDNFYVYITSPGTFNRLVNNSKSICESCIHKIQFNDNKDWICPRPLSENIINLFKGHRYTVIYPK